MLVSGAPDDTEKMRKAGADIFAKSGPEKTLFVNHESPHVVKKTYSCWYMGASHLSCCSKPLHLGHRLEERRLMSWSITEEKRKEKRNLKTPFLRSVIPRSQHVFSGRYTPG